MSWKNRRILLVSNRLPITIEKRKGRFYYRPSVGGLATALSSILRKYNFLWIGWPGLESRLKAQSKERIALKLSTEYNCYPVFIEKKDVEKFYYGFCNETLWPLFHYFPRTARYDSAQWECYKKVNELFCDKVVEIAKPDDIIWVHDYHLMHLPSLLRKKLPDATIGFFLHIPFPPVEIYRLLPWRTEILKGLLGADLIGFQTYEYLNNFLSAVLCFLGIDHELGTVIFEERPVKCDVFPISTDFETYFNASNDETVKKEIQKLRNIVGKRRIIFSIDRLDYIKGIPERIEAYETFLMKNPSWHGKVTFILVVSPSRVHTREYQLLHTQINELVGRINGKYGTVDWTPILYLYRTLTSTSLIALYLIADVALITPLRDGMNLVAKEYVAARSDGKGVLILSEMAGAAKELREAIIINPSNKEEVAEAIKRALEMPEEERIARNRVMQERLRSYDINRWVNQFFERLLEIKGFQEFMRARIVDNEIRSRLFTDYCKSSSRLILLDYDGTLVPFQSKPEDAKPDNTLMRILKKLSEDPKNEVVLISGRDRRTLDKWFSGLNISLVAEHGAWIMRKGGKEWEVIEPLTSGWKKEILPILRRFVDMVPGSFIEEKDFSLAWHYRNVDTESGILLSQELSNILTHLSANLEIGVLQGSKVIEVKNVGINKGRAALHFLSKKKFQFIMAIGDDFTDEALFRALPSNAYSIRVGMTPSYAKFNLESRDEVIQLLRGLAEVSRTAASAEREI